MKKRSKKGGDEEGSPEKKDDEELDLFDSDSEAGLANRPLRFVPWAKQNLVPDRRPPSSHHHIDSWGT